MVFGVWPDWLDWLLDGKKAFVSAMLNGVTLAGLYFLVASGFTLVFGLMRNVNLAHGSLYLFGAYIGYDAAQLDRQLVSGRCRGRARASPVVGALLQVFVFQRLTGDELRQTLVTHRHFDRRRRPDAGDLGRQDLPVLDPAVARRRGRDADHHRDQVERRRS